MRQDVSLAPIAIERRLGTFGRKRRDGLKTETSESEFVAGTL